jgi:predicted transcriptional regulator
MHKNYSEDIKVSVYAQLKTQKLRFTKLFTASGRNKVTLSEYLTHGQELGEIAKDPRTKDYYLTEKGQDELDRLEGQRVEKESPIRYSGEVDSLNELSSYDFDSYQIDGLVRLNELPLPIPVTTAIYGSEELAFLFNWGKDHLLYHDGVSPRQLSKAMLKGPNYSLVKQFLWMHILERLWGLAQWHGEYRANSKYPKPPSFTLENIIGFDLSLTVRYEGKKLAKSQDVTEIKRTSRRFVGALLLRIGCGITEGLSHTSTYEVITLLEEGGLLDAKDAAKVRRALRGTRPIRRRVAHGFETVHSSGGFGEPEQRIVLEVAIRYLKEGGILEIEDGMTPAKLAKRALTPIVVMKG